MEGWEPHLHWAFRQEHVLVRPLVLRSFSSFVVAGIFLTLLCTTERMLTASLERHWAPRILTSTRWRRSLWRTLLYSVVTFLRLCYMLAAMSFQLGVILVIVSGLSFGQFFIEYWASANQGSAPRGGYESQASFDHSYPLNPAVGSPRNRMRSRVPAHSILTHPVSPGASHIDQTTPQLYASGITDCALGQVSQTKDTSWRTNQEILKTRELLGQIRRNGADEEGAFLMDESDSENESSRL